MSTPPKAVLNPGACRRRRAFCPSSSSRPLPFLLRFVFDISGPSHYFPIISSLFHNALFLCSILSVFFSLICAARAHVYHTYHFSLFTAHKAAFIHVDVPAFLSALQVQWRLIFKASPPNLHLPVFIYQPSILSVR